MSDADKTLAILLICIILLSLFPVAGYLGIVLLISHLFRRNKVGELFSIMKQDPGPAFLLFSFGLSTLLSKNQSAGLVGLAVFSLQVILYIIIRRRITDRQQNLNIMRYVLMASLIVSVVGIFQYYFSHMSPEWLDKHLYNKIPNRAFSTLYNPNVLGSYLIIIISLASAGFRCTTQAWSKIVTPVVLVAAYFCMVLTYSRGAWLGLAVSILIILTLSKEKPYILSIIGVTLILTLPEMDAVLSRMDPGILSDDSSNTYRHYLWSTAVNIFKENPVLGAGLGSYGFYLPSHSTAAGYLVSHAHNIYLQILAETGLVGFIAFFGYILGTMYISFKLYRYSSCQQTRSLALGTMASIVGLLIHGSVDATLYLPQLSIFLWITAGVVRNAADFEYVPSIVSSRLGILMKPLLNRIFLNVK